MRNEKIYNSFQVGPHILTVPSVYFNNVSSRMYIFSDRVFFN